jgi:hypothetical protein
MERSGTLLLTTLLLFSGCMSEYEIYHDERTWNEPPDTWDLPEEYHTDKFYKPKTNPVDILFVVDNSGSMVDNAADIQANIPRFFSILYNNHINYQVAVTSTEGVGGLYPSGVLSTWAGEQFVTPKTLDPIASFSGMMNNRSGYGEAGIDAVMESMTTQFSNNKEFFRQGVPLHIITVTDEKEQSSTYSPGQLIAFLNGIVVPYKGEVVYSAVVNVPGSCNQNEIGWKYISVSKVMGGLVADICSDDWSFILEDIARYKTEQIYEYMLSHKPVVDTIKVTIEHLDITYVFKPGSDWTYDESSNSIEFSWYEHEEGDVIIVDYQVMK